MSEAYDNLRQQSSALEHLHNLVAHHNQATIYTYKIRDAPNGRQTKLFGRK